MTTTSDDPSYPRSILDKDVISKSRPSQNDEGLASPIAKKLASSSPSQPYSSFTKAQKWLIILLATFAATFSPLSSFIFFPAITALSESLHVPIAKINLTITSYMIVAGIAPAILGDLADTLGRRPVYLSMMSIYCAANVGLALQNNWATLFVLRMVQSAGSAGKQSFLSAPWTIKTSNKQSQQPLRLDTVLCPTLLVQPNVANSFLAWSWGKHRFLLLLSLNSKI